MKKFEKILIIIAILGLILKFLNLPLSGLLLFLSLMLLSGLYYFLGLAIVNNISPIKRVFESETYMGIKPIRIIVSVALGWGLSILITGILFDIQMYPLNNTFLSTGLIFTPLSLIVLLLLVRKNIFKEHLGVIIRTAAILIIALTLLLLPPFSLEKVQYRNHPGYLEAIKALDKDPENEILLKKFEEEKFKMLLGEEYDSVYPISDTK